VYAIRPKRLLRTNPKNSRGEKLMDINLTDIYEKEIENTIFSIGSLAEQWTKCYVQESKFDRLARKNDIIAQALRLTHIIDRLERLK
jgi:hypothetical protein